MKSFFNVLIILLLCANHRFTNAATPVQHKTNIVFASSQAIKLHSEKLDQDFTIDISLPTNYDKNTKYPVIYVLDSDIMFNLVSQYVLLNSFDPQIKPSIVVGIGFNSATMEALQQEQDKHYYPSINKDKNEGAQAFLKFLSTELLPTVEKTYPINDSERTLYGHASAGMFSLYAYLTAPALFQHYIASSPDLSWQEQWFLKNLSNEESKLTPYLYISLGRLEEEALEAVETYFRSKKVKYDPSRLNYRVFNGFNRMGVIAVSLAHAIQWVTREKAIVK